MVEGTFRVFRSWSYDSEEPGRQCGPNDVPIWEIGRAITASRFEAVKLNNENYDNVESDIDIFSFAESLIDKLQTSTGKPQRGGVSLDVGPQSSRQDQTVLEDTSSHPFLPGRVAHFASTRPFSDYIGKRILATSSDTVSTWSLKGCTGQRINKATLAHRHTTKAVLHPLDLKSRIEIRRTAEKLVESRRARAYLDADRWEAYCHGTMYVCSHSECISKDTTYQLRTHLRQHLEENHGVDSDTMELLDQGRCNAGTVDRQASR